MTGMHFAKFSRLKMHHRYRARILSLLVCFVSYRRLESVAVPFLMNWPG